YSPVLSPIGSRRGGEAPLDQRRPDPGQFHDLVPGAVARNERDGTARKRERIGEQPQDSLVRPTVLRHGGDAHLPCVAVTTDETCAARTRRHAQAETGGRFRHLRKCSPARRLLRPTPPASPFVPRLRSAAAPAS